MAKDQSREPLSNLKNKNGNYSNISRIIHLVAWKNYVSPGRFKNLAGTPY